MFDIRLFDCRATGTIRLLHRHMTRPGTFMNKHKRLFLCTSAAAALLPAVTPSLADTTGKGIPLLTIGGAIANGNRGPVDPVLDQLLVRHGINFSRALALDAERLQRLPRIDIRPTLEYDEKPHKLSGPLLTAVLGEAGVEMSPSLRVGLRAIDGYNVVIGADEIRSYRMIVATHIDDQPMALGGLGPQWAVHDADNLPAFKGKPVKERFASCPWGLYYIDVMKG